MMPASDNFIGGRLQLAREFRGLTQKELAEGISASHVIVSYYESGKRKNPNTEIVEAFAHVLGFQPSFFYGQTIPHTDWQCNFRHRRSATERTKRQIRAHAWLVGHVIDRLKNLVRFPDFNVPSLPGSHPEEIERAAEQCRKTWGLALDAPIAHVGRAIEHAGVFIVSDFVETRTVDAFSGHDSVSMIFLNRAIDSPSRWIYDIAHETGHLVLHRGIPTGSIETEEQANRFASAFLMPRKAFSREFTTSRFSWGHIWSLKKRWRVSAAAMIRRAYDLSLIGADSYRYAYKFLSAQGYRSKAEPHEPPFQEPELLPMAFRLLEKQSPNTLREMADGIGFKARTFEEVMGLSLGIKDAQIIKFPAAR